MNIKIIALTFFLLGCFVGVNIEPIMDMLNGSTSQVSNANKNLGLVTNVVEPYRIDVKDNKQIATFQIANPTNNAQTITYWTDDTSACDAKTVDYAPLVEIPVDNANFTFFQITDVEGVRSPIYAMSHNPIFQCGI